MTPRGAGQRDAALAKRRPHVLFGGWGRSFASTDVRGFTVIELLISTAITLIVMGVALAMVGHARDALDRDGMGLEAAQRLRAGLDVLTRDVRAAGSGPEADTAIVAFPHAFPAVELLAALTPAPGETARFGSVRVTAAPRSAAHGRLASGLVPGSPVRLRAPPNCPAVPACGFSEGTAAVIYDGSGAFDRVVVTGVDPASWSLVVSPAVSRPYAEDAVISEVIVSTFRVDIEPDGMGRLVRQTTGGAVQPIVDHVVRFGVEVFGEAAPPWAGRTPLSPPTYGPMPAPPNVDDPRDTWPAGENCTMALGTDGLATPRLPPLGGLGELIAVEPSMLQDGPWCAGTSGEAYDADLFRIRRVDLRLRVEASAARLRGPAGALFSRGGHGQGSSWSPDLELRVSVSPPNLGRR